MKVKLLGYTQDALDLLVYTKNTRLMGEQTLDQIKQKPLDWKLDHLEYMFKTIQSSFEFVHYTFEITGVSRSFTHQLVRTRNASYAQESQRTVDVRNSEIYNPSNNTVFDDAAHHAVSAYGHLVDEGVPVQEAREILPTGINTSIIMKVNLRELAHMAEVRMCTRTAGQYQEVFKEMRQRVIEVHPYFADYINVYCVKHGRCCFPNYKECPVQRKVPTYSEEDKNAIQYEYDSTDHVANPIAKDGKTM